ncbi:MAG: hypothetical protein ACJ79R_04835 [Anaeromyxobacteraceae bacterium]
MGRAALAAAALALFTMGHARADGPTPVTLAAGASLKLCQSGLVHCPASTVLCDDPKVARIENGADGAELKGVAPGETTCSALGFGTAFRRVLRVTVTPAPRG